MVNATLMNIADNPTNVQLPGMYNKEDNPRVPIIVTGNDFSTLYAPLIRDGRMEKFYWAPTREDRIGVCTGIFKTDHVAPEDVVKLVDTFPGQSIGKFLDQIVDRTCYFVKPCTNSEVSRSHDNTVSRLNLCIIDI
jgi:hypothetical protein